MSWSDDVKWRDEAPAIEMYGKRIPDIVMDRFSMIGCWCIGDPKERAAQEEWWDVAAAFEAEFGGAA